MACIYLDSTFIWCPTIHKSIQGNEFIYDSSKSNFLLSEVSKSPCFANFAYGHIVLNRLPMQL